MSFQLYFQFPCNYSQDVLYFCVYPSKTNSGEESALQFIEEQTNTVYFLISDQTHFALVMIVQPPLYANEPLIHFKITLFLSLGSRKSLLIVRYNTA